MERDEERNGEERVEPWMETSTHTPLYTLRIYSSRTRHTHNTHLPPLTLA